MSEKEEVVGITQEVADTLVPEAVHPELTFGEDVSDEEAPRKLRGNTWVPDGFQVVGNRAVLEAVLRFEQQRNSNEVFRPGSEDTLDSLRGEIVHLRDWKGLDGLDAAKRLVAEANTLGSSTSCNCTQLAKEARRHYEDLWASLCHTCEKDHQTRSGLCRVCRETHAEALRITGGKPAEIEAQCTAAGHHRGWWSSPKAAGFVIGARHRLVFADSDHEDVASGEQGFRPLRSFRPRKPHRREFSSWTEWAIARRTWKRQIRAFEEALETIEGRHNERPSLELRNLARIEQARTLRRPLDISFEEIPLARLKGANAYDEEALFTQDITFLNTSHGVVAKQGGLLEFEERREIDCPRPMVWPRSITEHLQGRYGPWKREYQMVDGVWVSRGQEMDQDFLRFLLNAAVDEILELICNDEPRWPETKIRLVPSESLTLKARDLGIIAPNEVLPVPIETRAPLSRKFVFGIEQRTYSCNTCGRATPHYRDVIKWKPTWFGKSGAWLCDGCGRVAKDRILQMKIRFKVSAREGAAVRDMVLNLWGAGFIRYYMGSLERRSPNSARLLAIATALAGQMKKPGRRIWEVVGNPELA